MSEDLIVFSPGIEGPPSYHETLAAAPPPPPITQPVLNNTNTNNAALLSSVPQLLPPPSRTSRERAHSAASSKTFKDPSALVKPTTLCIGGRFLYSSLNRSQPLYEFSHQIGFLRDTDHTVRCERVDHVPKSTSDGSTSITCRKRHLYNLRHPTLMEGSPYEFYGEATSRTTRSFGLDCVNQKSLFSLAPARKSKSYIVRKAVMKGSNKIADSGQILFAAVPARDTSHGVNFEWEDEATGGRVVAREVEQGGLVNLVITELMEVWKRDLLVAAWIDRIWCELAKGNYKEKKWDQEGGFADWLAAKVF